MKIKILKPIAGSGDFVAGFAKQFALDCGMTVEVESSMAAKWIASGIAESAERAPETAMLEKLSPSTLPRTKAKPKAVR